MKIAYLTPEYPHSDVDNPSGGIGTSIYTLAEGLSALGHGVVILVYNQSKDDIIQSDEATICKIRNKKLKGLSWWLTRKKIEKLINKLYKEKQIDILEVSDWTGITSFMRCKCPIVVKLHGSDTYFCHLENRPVKWLNKYHEKKALISADAYISVSQYAAKVTNEIFKLNIDFKIIPNAVDTGYFEPIASEKTENNCKILYFGTLIRKKGVLELAHIFNEVIKSLPQAQLILIGQDASDIKTQSKSTYNLMLDIFDREAVNQQNYLGKVPYKEIKNYIKEAKVIVFPSFVEALPVSWLEAMAMEKIIVASDIGWASEVIEDNKSGFILNPKRHKQFATKIIDILTKKIETEEMSKYARTHVIENFSSENVALRHVKFYEEIILNGK